MTQHKDIDWEAIEREYRAGQLSVREIGRQQGVVEGTIRKRAKKEGWERDLTDQVCEEVRRQLVRNDEDAPPTHEECVLDTNDDKEIVRRAANRAVTIVKLHRQDAKEQREILSQLTQELGLRLAAIQSLRGIALGGGDKKAPVLTPLTLSELKDTSTIARNAAGALKNITSIERQAFNIDAHPEGEDEVKRVIIITRRKNTGEDGDRAED